jgi:hypothetical protein
MRARLVKLYPIFEGRKIKFMGAKLRGTLKNTLVNILSEVRSTWIYFEESLKRFNIVEDYEGGWGQRGKFSAIC